MTQWRGALATTSLLLAVIGLLGSRPALVPEQQARSQESALPSAVRVTASPQTTAPFYTYHSTSAGFDVRLPRGWAAVDSSVLFSRRSVRLLVVGNRGAPVPPSANTTPLPGQVPDWTQLATDQIVLELSMLAGPGGPSADTESSFPLDWSNARPIADGQGNVGAAMSLTFQHLARPLSLVARIGTHAPPSDVAEIAGIVASLTPEPIPTQGEYRGWRVIGPLASLPVGSVRHFPSTPSHAYGFHVVRGAKTVFAFLDRAYLFMAGIKPAPIRYDAATRTFICDDTGESWSRVGKQLTGPGHFGLAFHSTFVKDGIVLVGGGSGASSRNDHDEAAEFSDPIGPVATSGSITKAEILRRYSRITGTTPTVRAAAKLVPTSVAMVSEVVRSVVLSADIPTVWIMAFAGDVRPGVGDAVGKWMVFVADPRTGSLLTTRCCGEGDWPPGFDRLPDLAGP
jgi:hypothetical protein